MPIGSTPIQERYVVRGDRTTITGAFAGQLCADDVNHTPPKLFVWDEVGASWDSIAPSLVADKDRAETFAESDVTLSHTNTEVASESIRLLRTGTGNIITRTADDTSTNATPHRGVKINPNTALDGIQADISGNVSGATHGYLYAADGTTVLEKVSISGGSIEIAYELAAGTDYFVAAGAEGSSYTIGWWDAASYPITGIDMDVVNGWNGPGAGTQPDHFYNLNNLQGLDPVASGSVTVSWPYPNDVYAWDVAQFQETLDGETVGVYLEEDQAAGWTEIAGPIARGADIDADAENNVRFRVELSGTGGGSPTLDAIYRTWEV